MPIRKWQKRARNLVAGDVVMMCYEGNLKDDYRLARVLEVYPDQNGLVRTVRVGYRQKNKTERKDVYKRKPLVEEKVAVQRLCLLVPCEKED